jgi:hypothetical protein
VTAVCGKGGAGGGGGGGGGGGSTVSFIAVITRGAGGHGEWGYADAAVAFAWIQGRIARVLRGRFLGGPDESRSSDFYIY